VRLLDGDGAGTEAAMVSAPVPPSAELNTSELSIDFIPRSANAQLRSILQYGSWLVAAVLLGLTLYQLRRRRLL